MKKYTSLYIIISFLIITALLCFVIPSGNYDNGIFSFVTNNKNVLYELFYAPINGYIGINDGSTIFYNNSGVNSGVVVLSLLIISVYMYTNVVVKTNFLSSLIIKYNNYFEKNINLLIILLILFFSIASFTHGMYETTIAFAGILFMIFSSYKISKMYVIKLILFSTSIGYIGSTINPFATKLASDLANVSLSEQFYLRLSLFIVLLVVTIFYLLYDKKNHIIDKKEIVHENIEVKGYDFIIFIIPFFVMSYSFLPYDLMFKLDTYGVIIMFLLFSLYFGKKYIKSITKTLDLMFLTIKDVFLVVLILTISRGIYVLLFNTQVDDTIVYYLVQLLHNVNNIYVVLIVIIFYMVLSLFISSSSAVAYLTIPILSSVFVSLNISSALLVTIYQSSIGILHIFSITSVVVVSLLSIAKIKYVSYLKEIYLYVIMISIIIVLFIIFSI